MIGRVFAASSTGVATSDNEDPTQPRAAWPNIREGQLLILAQAGLGLCLTVAIAGCSDPATTFRHVAPDKPLFAAVGLAYPGSHIVDQTVRDAYCPGLALERTWQPELDEVHIEVPEGQVRQALAWYDTRVRIIGYRQLAPSGEGYSYVGPDVHALFTSPSSGSPNSVVVMTADRQPHSGEC